MEARALVIERFSEMRDVIVAILRREHFIVDVADDFSASADAGSYDVVVADVPFDETAASVERRILQKHPALASRIVLMSANGEEASLVHAQLLEKPFERSGLVDAVHRLSA